MSGNWYPVCKIEEIPRASGRTIMAGERAIAIFRLSDDTIRAIDNRCPHKGGPLADGVISGGDILCPLHNWRIDLESGQVASPESGCVTPFPVKIEADGQILLQL